MATNYIIVFIPFNILFTFFYLINGIIDKMKSVKQLAYVTNAFNL